ncbi:MULTISPECIES: alpha-glucosidase [unclassified Clostridium]|uniref:glycoside hydrolase family 13 protein n=1 Tax=unclassified Clostridium TaxID=2614128 RepID=UPI0013F90DCA|nr:MULTISPECIES: alpha-glucosidase [unclassified Clostridium]MBN1044038.1 alpha-glucosidase [Clostridium botulinum]MBN1050728.1 alpha-glucosidase [Clostridium botulinum]MBN1054023.1 alpha-glucosidase [Clostridium botulinum]NFR86907.1 alpha-glucosidase [Clostridium botulinum]NFR90461.1 alpha-glucosidase [Clostridium botulinum]
MKKIWWKEAIGYQIYPRSFKDSNGDGIGDLRGIISKLDYLKELGIDVIWICPMYKSPNDDNGYDISDYQDIMEDFGEMADFDELLTKVHKRGMKLIIDLVINHTSDEHKWFVESKSSKDSPKRDWYVWKEGKDGSEPNNWESIFKGSAWEYDENTEEYFLHLFSKRQPDLNWENPEVRNELYKMVNWWLDKGIDGFRVDAISHIKKDQTFEDIKSKSNERYVSSFEKHMNFPGIHRFLAELADNTFENYDIMTVGEANGVDSEEAELWVGEEDGKFNMVFQFEHLNLWDYDSENKLSVVGLKKALTKWQNNLNGVGWNALFIENHDIPRVISTWGNDENYRRECAKALGLMYFMQQGTPFIYQGQELGMTNVKFENINKYDDIKSINIFNERVECGVSKEEALKEIWAISRDNSRTPMQWNDSENAGFSNNKPWIDVNSNYKEINVESELKDPNSVLNFYKKMIDVKKNSETLSYGEYKLILDEDENIYSYMRILGDKKYMIICNLSDNENLYKYEKETLTFESLILSNYEVNKHDKINSINLKPWECRLYKLM